MDIGGVLFDVIDMLPCFDLNGGRLVKQGSLNETGIIFKDAVDL